MNERHIRQFVEKLQLQAYSVDAQFDEARDEKIASMDSLKREKSKLLKEMGKR